MNKFLFLLFLSFPFFSEEKVNQNVLFELESMIMDDPATQALIISHNNEIILEEYAEGYDKDSLGTTWSIAKTFYGSLIGVAINSNLDVSLEMPLKNFISQFENDSRGDITLEELLAMKSGFKITEHENQEMFFSLDNLDFALNVKIDKPSGEIFEYNNVNTMLLNPVIEHIFKKEPHDVLIEEIFVPLDIKKYGLWEDSAGNDMTYYGIDLTARDLLKFGQLIDNNGVWNGKQIIDSEYLHRSISPLSKGKGEWFGLHWSIRKMSENKTLVGLEVTDGEMLYIIPEENIVVVRLTKYIHNPNKGYQINFGPLSYILWLPYSWVRAISEYLAPAPTGPDEEFVDDPNLNIPNTQAKGISMYHCPFTSPDECPGVSRIQDLIFGLSEPSPN